MRFARFQHRDRIAHGLIEGDAVMDLSADFPRAAAAIAAMHAGGLQGAAGPKIALDEVAFLPPTPDGRYFCIGYNYHEHRAELDASAIAPPTLFVRNPASMVGHGQPLIHGAATRCYDFEGELAAVIGAECRAADPAEALRFVAGYSCFMDGSARDVQKSSVGAGKNFDRSGSVGPWVLAASNAPDPQRLRIETRVNGETVQSASTGDMILSVADIVAYISSFIVLQPGDVIATGTPAGVGMSRDPPLWLQPGDVVEVEIDAVGRLHNPVQSPGGG